MSHSTNYAFPPLSVRAQCIQVVDGFTLQLLIDCGFGNYHVETVRLRDIEPTSDEDIWHLTEERGRQRELQQWLRDLLKPVMVTDAALLNDWPVRVVVHKIDPSSSVTRYPKRVPQWEVDVYVLDPVERPHRPQHEIHVNAQLKELGLAQAFRR